MQNLVTVELLGDSLHMGDMWT